MNDSQFESFHSEKEGLEEVDKEREGLRGIGEGGTIGEVGNERRVEVGVGGGVCEELFFDEGFDNLMEGGGIKKFLIMKGDEE